MNTKRKYLIGILCLFAATSCQKNEDAPEQRRGNLSPHRTTLRWKRYRVLQNDLARALALSPSEVCKEAGGKDCATSRRVMLKDWLGTQVEADQVEATCSAQQGRPKCEDGVYIDLQSPQGVHVLSLGGNDPFLGESYEPLATPGLTTPLAFDRMVLSACGERAKRDDEGEKVVFAHYDLKGEVSPTSQGITESITDLYKRLLARDPKEAEINILKGLAEPKLKGREFAQLICYTIATTTEFLFQ